MNLIMITPRVGESNPLLAFIPTWITHLAYKIDRLWVITPRAESIKLPNNVIVYEVGRNYCKGETIFHAIRNFHSALWRLTRNEQVHGIFTHMYPKFAIMAAPYAKFNRIPLVMWFTHETINGQLKLASLLVDRILTATPETCRLKNSKIEVIGHGIDIETFTKQIQKSEHSGFVIVTVGRISPIKNLEVIIQAVHILVKSHSLLDIKLLVIGKPPTPDHRQYLEHIKNLVRVAKLENHVDFIGEVEHAQIPYIFQRSDVFINACNSGFDKAILEAMAFKIPVVVSNPTFKSILGKHAYELMFSPGNSHELAQRLAFLAGLPCDELKHLGQSMREIVQSSHDVDSLSEKIVHEFNSFTRYS